MNRDEANAAVLDAVSACLECDPAEVAEDAAIYRTLGWDSLAHIAIVTEIEALLNIQIPDTQIESLISVSALVDFAYASCNDRPTHNQLEQS